LLVLFQTRLLADYLLSLLHFLFPSFLLLFYLHFLYCLFIVFFCILFCIFIYVHINYFLCSTFLISVLYPIINRDLIFVPFLLCLDICFLHTWHCFLSYTFLFSSFFFPDPLSLFHQSVFLFTFLSSFFFNFVPYFSSFSHFTSIFVFLISHAKEIEQPQFVSFIQILVLFFSKFI